MNNQNTKKTNTHFIINFFDGEISGTQTSFNRAGKGVSPYYEELTTLINAHPEFKLGVKEPKKSKKPKRTYRLMNFAFMEAYISIQSNSELLKKEYESVKAYAKNAGFSIYPFTKKWFLGEFDPDKEGFDMKKAIEEITQAGIDKAVLNANEDETEEAA